MDHDVPEECRPRLCHVVKWKHFQGFGFNLHAEKGKSGQFIGKVDQSSPAEAAGLKEGDRIVEVNGENIGNENHQQVVGRIKDSGDEALLLVVDQNADNWYKNEKRVVRGDLPEVRFISSKRDEDGDRLSGHGQFNGDKVLNTNSHSVPVETDADDSQLVHKLYRPRLCHLKYWAHFEGFGFNLHAEKDKPGQYIGLVDDNSPASTGGLLVNDRIIEVNGVNIEQEKHPVVIAKIREIHGETKLLVVDKETDQYYQSKGITVSSTMPQIDYIKTPDADTVQSAKSAAPPSSQAGYSSSAEQPTREYSSAVSTAKGADGLELNLSVAEMKERLKAKKKQDPRLSKVPFDQKYKEFQRM